MRQSVKGYLSPVSLREGRSLVLPPELYDALYLPRPMVPPVRPVGSPWKGAYGKDDRSSTQPAPFDTPAPVPGGAAAMMRMDNRVTTFAETQEGSATEWESETETTAPITGMRPAGMSDEDWEEGDLDMGYHPTSEVADVPPVMDDREIEGARSALPPDSRLQEDAHMRTETTEGITQYPPADEIIKAESRYGNPEAEDETFATDDDGTKGDDYDVVIEEIYYERGEEELDYHDDAAVEEGMPTQDEDSRPVDEDEDVNADDEEEDDPAVNEFVRPKKGKDAPVWGRLGTPVGDRSTTDTEIGETADLMESVVLGSPDRDPTNEESPPSRSRRSDRESTVLSDDDRRSRGYSSDSSRSSCRSVGSKRHQDQKEKPLPKPKGSSQLNPPETTTPWQSPHQKQIKMTESNLQPTTATPTMSSVIQMAKMPAQDLMHAHLNDMEQRIPGISGEAAPPSSRNRRRSDTGLRPQRPRYPMTQRLRLKQMEMLCAENRDEYIYRMTYKVNMDRYAHFTEDLKVLGSNAKEMIWQVIATCVWAYEYHQLTRQIEGPYLPYLLWSPMPRVEGCRTPTICPGQCDDYRLDVRRSWLYLVVLLQFWMDNNAR